IAIQFFDWIKNMLTGDFGMSIYSSEPVLDIILSHFGPTFSLMAVSLFLMLLIAVPAAIFAVIKRDTAVNPIFLSSSLIDRKSTRLNSSHVSISYAVFCLKKKIIDAQSF